MERSPIEENYFTILYFIELKLLAFCNGLFFFGTKSLNVVVVALMSFRLYARFFFRLCRWLVFWLFVDVRRRKVYLVLFFCVLKSKKVLLEGRNIFWTQTFAEEKLELNSNLWFAFFSIPELPSFDFIAHWISSSFSLFAFCP